MIGKGNGKAGATKLTSILIAALMALSTLTSCAVTEGPKGESGNDGKSAYEVAFTSNPVPSIFRLSHDSPKASFSATKFSV